MYLAEPGAFHTTQCGGAVPPSNLNVLVGVHTYPLDDKLTTVPNTLGVTAVYGGKAAASTATTDVYERSYSYTVAECYTTNIGQEIAYYSLNHERSKIGQFPYYHMIVKRYLLIQTPPYNAGDLDRWNGRQNLPGGSYKVTTVTFLGNLRRASLWQLLPADDGTEAAPITSAGGTDATGPLGVNNTMTVTVLLLSGFFGQQGLYDCLLVDKESRCI
ncbi:hypothetical protein EDD17DRAFT_1547374 [Pisolithus thermaeus]|nr:hypothetical protein EDD17DRAFT_1547374 [Pisolithus thermaeus]